LEEWRIMAKSIFETTIGAFEDRMMLRRRMLKVTGVEMKKRRIPEVIEDEIRDSIINCYECKSGDACMTWLEKAEKGAPPPEFCPNRDTILRIKSMGHTDEIEK
jgi:hypothetical protein